MRKITVLLLLIAVNITAAAQADYYFPGKDKFNPGITSPWEFLGYDIGEHHTRYDRIVEYIKTLSEESDRADFRVFGYTEERRPQIILTISSPGNINDLDNIRQKHLELAQGHKEKVNGQSQIPLTIQLGFNVHGNEASGGEASLLAAYYLVASEEDEMMDMLNNSVIFIEPVLNPDGRDRFASWVNMNKGNPPVPDPNDREHNEAWPGGRTNHYWFDLNRDWLPLSQVESINRVKRYHRWLPNVITDHHEMGTNSTFFFEPTKKGSENPIITTENYIKLNNIFATEYASALNAIDHYYDSGRSFDNSYPGYGSTYGDVHGGLAILFEQASSRGIVQETDLGYELRYRLGIRNQLFAALTTVRTSLKNHALLNDYMRRFYYDALQEANDDPVKAYIFSVPEDKTRARAFIELLKLHNVDVYENGKDITLNGQKYKAGNSWFVPTVQKQYKMVRTIFEANFSFPDSLFYDASAWAMAYSYGVNFDALKKEPAGRILSKVPVAEYTLPEFSTYGYLLNWSDYNAAKALFYLQNSGIRTRAAWQEFSIKTDKGMNNYSRGSIFIPVQYQDADPEEVFQLVTGASEYAGISIDAVPGSVTNAGPWIGNGSFRAVSKPKILMLAGDGVRSTNAGALWHFFETKTVMPVTKIRPGELPGINLSDYTALIMPSGYYNDLDERAVSKITEWTNKGGTLIALGYSIRALEDAGIIDIDYTSSRPQPDKKRIDYDMMMYESGVHSIGGIFCKADLDTSHPLGFGYDKRSITVYRNNTLFVSPSQGKTSNVAVYEEEPLVSGFCSDENLEKMKNTVSLMSLSKGRGNIILFIDDPVFRGFCYGSNKMLMNAVFFGPEI